jgi:hypothetical protein
VDVQQIIPLPEVQEYQVQVREKAQKERQARTSGADYKRFDVRIDGEPHPTMSKRSAIFLICKHICEKGVNPDDITALFDWAPNRVWFSVDGVVDAPEFRRIADAQTSSGTYHSRWFCGDGELIEANGKTYALSNQWGDPYWLKAMTLLKERYPQFKIDFSSST